MQTRRRVASLVAALEFAQAGESLSGLSLQRIDYAFIHIVVVSRFVRTPQGLYICGRLSRHSSKNKKHAE